jgi:hypothetical protein
MKKTLLSVVTMLALTVVSVHANGIDDIMQSKSVLTKVKQ